MPTLALAHTKYLKVFLDLVCKNSSNWSQGNNCITTTLMELIIQGDNKINVVKISLCGLIVSSFCKIKLRQSDQGGKLVTIKFEIIVLRSCGFFLNR